MVDSVNIQPQVITKKDNATRNTAVAMGIGAIGGGTAGYMTKNLMKNGAMTDEFVSEITNQALKLASDGDKAEYKVLKDILKLEDNPSAEALKKLVKKHSKYFGLNKETLKDALAEIDESVTTFISNKVNPVREQYKEVIDEVKNIIQDSYDAESKKFNLKNQEGLKILNKVKHSIKGRAGLIWGGAGAIILGFGTWVLSKVTGNKEV